MPGLALQDVLGAELSRQLQPRVDAVLQGRAQHLFRAFEQADNPATRRHGGTGLGWALIRHIAETMGGSEGLDSQPGVGSTFRCSGWFHRACASAGAGAGAGCAPVAGPGGRAAACAAGRHRWPGHHPADPAALGREAAARNQQLVAAVARRAAAVAV